MPTFFRFLLSTVSAHGNYGVVKVRDYGNYTMAAGRLHHKCWMWNSFGNPPIPSHPLPPKLSDAKDMSKNFLTLTIRHSHPLHTVIGRLRGGEGEPGIGWSLLSLASLVSILYMNVSATSHVTSQVQLGMCSKRHLHWKCASSHLNDITSPSFSTTTNLSPPVEGAFSNGCRHFWLVRLHLDAGLTIGWLRAGCPLIGRSAVRSLAPPVHVSMCSLARCWAHNCPPDVFSCLVACWVLLNAKCYIFTTRVELDWEQDILTVHKTQSDVQQS